MKDFWRYSIIVVAAIVATCLFAGTGWFRGESAYQVAVRTGFTGSEQDFINWLRGDDGTPGEDGDALVAIVEAAYAQYLIDNPEPEDYVDLLTFISQYFRGETGNSTVQDAANLTAQSAVSIKAEIKDGRGSTATLAGSGVIYKLGYSGGALNGDMYIITNYHVISNYSYASGSGSTMKLWTAQKVEVSLYGMASVAFSATVLGGSSQYDIAVLYVNGGSAVTKPAGDSRNVKTVIQSTAIRATDVCANLVPVLGAPVIAVGNPLDGGLSVNEGIISRTSERIPMEDLANPSQTALYRVIRISCGINPGNSGGGLFNNKGELVGIIEARTFWNSTSKDYPVDNMAYAIPLDIAIRIANQIMERFAADPSLVNASSAKSIAMQKPIYGIELSGTNWYTVYEDNQITECEDVIVSALGTWDTLGAAYKPSTTNPNLTFKKDDIVKTMSYIPLQYADEVNAEDYRITYDITRSYQVAEFLIECWRDEPVTYTVDRSGTTYTFTVVKA